MKARFLRRFDKSFGNLDSVSQTRITMAVSRLMEDPRHPSLRVKKMEGWGYIWEASASMDLRITFHYEKPDTIVFRNCGHHDPTLKKP